MSEVHKKYLNEVKHNVNTWYPDICWDDSVTRIPRIYNRKKWAEPDLVGKDSKGSIVIVEAKNKIGDHPNDRIRESVGQVLDCAITYMKYYRPKTVSEDYSKHLRLFIITREFLQPIEDICEFLRAQNINIEHKVVKMLQKH